jgi:hypothetical protein
VTVLDEIRGWRAALDELVACLWSPGTVPSGRLEKQESVAALKFGNSLGSLDKIRQPDLDHWFDRFQDALTLTFDLPAEEGGPQALQKTLTLARHVRADLDEIAGESTKYSRPVEITVTLKKNLLGERLQATLGVEDRLRVLPFFFAASLKQILSGMDFRSFEQDFLVDPDGSKIHDRLLLLVADAGGQLRGPFLAILGNDQPGRAEAFARTRAPLGKLAAARELMQAKCNWIGVERPKILTPHFFRLGPADPSGGLEENRGELLRLQNELSLPFLADRTTSGDAGLEVIFEGKSSVKIPIGQERTSAAPYRLYHWVYLDPDGGETRLEIVRRVVSSRFPSGDGSFEVLVASGPELLSECVVQLQVLIDGKLTESFERRERVDKLVREYADETRKQIASLARELVDDAYKTAGLVLGVVIAYLLEPSRGPLVLTLGAFFYAAYFLFVRLFYLPTLGQEQEARQHAFSERKKEILSSGILTKEAKKALASVQGDDQRLTARRARVFHLYEALAAAPLALLVVGLVAGWWRATPQDVRRQALAEQAERFEALGYDHLRRAVVGEAEPLPLTDARGRTAYPDLTALEKSATLVAVAWVPCARIGRADEFQRLRLLAELAHEKGVELQLLTEAVCRKEAGPHRLRTWLQSGGLPAFEIWTN